MDRTEGEVDRTGGEVDREEGRAGMPSRASRGPGGGGLQPRLVVETGPLRWRRLRERGRLEAEQARGLETGSVRYLAVSSRTLAGGPTASTERLPSLEVRLLKILFDFCEHFLFQFC